MAYLSRKDIEALGERVFAAYRHIPSIQGQCIQKVEPVTLAKELCGLNVDYYHLSRSGAVLGLTSTSQVGTWVMDDAGNHLVYQLDGKTILIESDLRENKEQRGRHHFTVVHETAHQILDRMYPKRNGGIAARIHYSVATSRPSYPVDDWDEWQANALASCLLMPAELVMAALHRFDLAGGINILNKVFFPKEYERFCHAADTLEVSKRALALRLRRLGLLRVDHLNDPYKLVNVEVD